MGGTNSSSGSHAGGRERSPGALTLAALIATPSLLAAMSGCNQHTANTTAPGPDPAQVEMQGLTGMGPLSSCGGSEPTTTNQVRIRIPKDINDVFETGSVARHTTYQRGGSPEANETTTNSVVMANPYHTDLTDQAVTGQIVKYSLIIDASTNMTFLKGDPHYARLVNGVLGQRNLDGTVFICSDDLKNGGKTATFYVQNIAGQPAKFDGFNIVLVPGNRSTDTPIIIDPKILNNG